MDGYTYGKLIYFKKIQFNKFTDLIKIFLMFKIQYRSHILGSL